MLLKICETRFCPLSVSAPPATNAKPAPWLMVLSVPKKSKPSVEKALAV